MKDKERLMLVFRAVLVLDDMIDNGTSHSVMSREVVDAAYKNLGHLIDSLDVIEPEKP